MGYLITLLLMAIAMCCTMGIIILVFLELKKAITKHGIEVKRTKREGWY